MKPLMLTMTAFGPFHETAVVDFRKLGENPFFIISGPTGAGKTTILDGICFALYGTSSGAERKDDDLRSRSADRKTETKVTLLFEVAGKRYLIERWPRQEVPRKRGNAEETTTQQHKVVFAQVDANGLQMEGSLIKDVRPVDQKVEAILGLTAAQFRQVVLLPQGEFRDFLLSDTKARAEILKKLFKSDRFEAIETELKKRRSGLDAELTGIRDQNQGRYSGAGVEGPEQLDEAIHGMEETLEGLRAAEGAAGIALAHAEEALAEGRRVEVLFVRMGAAIEEFGRIEAGRLANNEKRMRADRAEKALRLDPAAQRVAELAGEVKGKALEAGNLEIVQARLITKRDEAKVSLAAAGKRKEKECPPLEAEKHSLEAALPKFADRAAAAAQAKEARKNSLEAKKEKDRLQSEVDRANERLKTLNRDIPLLTKEVAGKGVLEERLMAAKAREEETAGIVSLEGGLPGAKKRVAEAEKAFEAATKACKDAKKMSEDLQSKAIKGQAIVLAKSLKDGAPCPVCGSTEHPKKAKGKAGEVPDESELNGALEAVSEAEETLEAARKEKTEAERDRTEIESRIAQAKDTLGKKPARSKGTADDPAALERDIKALEAKARELSKVETEKAAIERSFPGNRAALESALSALSLASEAAERHEARLAELNKHVPGEYADAKAAQGRIAEVGGRIAKLEFDMEKFRKEVEEGEKTLAANVARHGEVTKACKEAEEKLADAKKKFAEDLLAEGFVDEALFRESLLAKEEIEFLKEEIRKFDAAAAAAKSAREKAGEACKELTRPDLPSLGTVKSEADKAKNAAFKARVQAGERKDVLEETKRQIGEALVAQKTLESSLAVVGRLASLASGENAKKVGLHTYYLAALFDEVARSASHRLDRMSRARYRLRRTDEVGDARGKAGLDLVVSDSWSGAERPVRTLSGGESFLASLSLALGLSDAVLAQSGGRSLDSLFVDEGFGSLDQESLDMALRTLQELQGAGTASGRAVGIISHIDEVKKAVGKRIEVTRNPGEATSTIQIKI